MRGSSHEPDAWRSLDKLMATQLGTFHCDQAASLGISQDSLYRATRNGRLHRDLPRVYRDPAVPLSPDQRRMAALLWAGDGAALSHRSAAALWELAGPERVGIELTAPIARRAPKGLLVHRSELIGAEVTTLNGFRTTSPTRTIIDLARVVSEEDLETALDQALRRGLTSVDYLTGRLFSLGTKGRKGSGALARMLKARGDHKRALESPLETRFFRLIRRARLPIPQPGYSVGPYRLDFAYPQAKLGIELEGHAFHSGKSAWLKDVARRNFFADLGWMILYFTWHDVTGDPSNVIATIRRHLYPTLVS